MNGQGAYDQGAGNILIGGDLFGAEGMERAGAGVKMAVHAAEGFFGRLININELRRYFAVSTDYVLNKLKLILFPYTHRGSWQRATIRLTGDQTNGEFTTAHPPPRADINAPDLYIPVMAFVTYIIICAMVAGISGGFRPEMLSIIASKALVLFALDVMVLVLGYKLLSNSSPAILDSVSLCGYVFVGVAVNELAQLIGGKWLLYPCLLFTCAGVSVFLMRTVRVILLSDPAPVNNGNPYGGYSDQGYGGAMDPTLDPSIAEQSRRRYFLIFLALMQLLVMYFLAFSPTVVSSSTNNGQPQTEMYNDRRFVERDPEPEPAMH